MKAFRLNANVKIIANEPIAMTKPIQKAIHRFYRDCSTVLEKNGDPHSCEICLEIFPLPAEQYRCTVTEDALFLEAGDDRGFVYGLNWLSETYLGIHPLWFWNDQKISSKHYCEIPTGVYESTPSRIRYRGWFVNDEVLLQTWTAGVSPEYPWEMAFEALLRLGGNLIIPGTDKNSKKYAALASDMGLIITHHHAEPLGAEMFTRAYPDLEPSYQRYPELFQGLWRDSINNQKHRETIWNIGFRGQGDIPFWENDPAYDTPQKRGQLISDLMRIQYDLVKEEDPDAVLCTNLYGEIMELYRDGYLDIPEDVIAIWADNGYGKMVSRRQENHNPRIIALPPKPEGRHGVYYHASFYDLQAANHITMLPNPPELVKRELENAYQKGIQDYWLINCSNVKPHVYTLDYLANLWQAEPLPVQEHRMKYLRKYYPIREEELMSIAECIQAYYFCTVPFGDREDEHAGEQFYTYPVRDLIWSWMKGNHDIPCEKLKWCADVGTLAEQVRWYQQKCSQRLPAFEALYQDCKNATQSELWRDSVQLQTNIHRQCLQGAVSFCNAYDRFQENDLQGCFYLLGQAAECYEQANEAMRWREYGKWKGFYANDCLSDIKYTAHCLKRLMGYIRNLGDGPDFYLWQRDILYDKQDSKVVLITNFENHYEDWSLYLEMKRRQAV